MIGTLTAGLYGTGVAAATNSYESIATVTVGSGGASSIDFTSIPSTYKHLQIRGIGRTLYAGTGDSNTYLYLNGTEGSYSHLLYGTGSAAGATNNNNSFLACRVPNNNNTANAYGSLLMDILDVNSTSKNKTVRCLNGWDANGSGLIYFSSVLWNSTSAVTSITLTTQDGSWKEFSSLALYGIRG